MGSNESIAIVGMGLSFPGAQSPQAFWELLEQGCTQSRPATAQRWGVEPQQAYSPEVGAADRVYSRHACFIEQLPPLSRAGQQMCQGLDPLFWHSLYAGEQTWQDTQTALNPARAGIICGNLALPSSHTVAWVKNRVLPQLTAQLSKNTPQPEVHPKNVDAAGLPAAMVAQHLNLEGPCLTLDAACASSLYAVYLAARQLRSGTVDAMLAGGLCCPDSLYTQMGFSQLRALSPKGVCAPFDAEADGLVVGEGAGMVLLKRTADALRQGDRIYAVIQGMGLSNDVGGNLMAPKADGQLQALQAAYAQAQWHPWEVPYIECHATGTPVGDAEEIRSLRYLWQQAPQGHQACLGAVKANIGHLLTAAGIASLIKACLVIDKGRIPPTPNHKQPQKTLAAAQGALEIATTARDLPLIKGRRRAAVSAFGFGGINAHLLLENAGPTPVKARSRSQRQPIAIVGWGSYSGLWQNVAEYWEVLQGQKSLDKTTAKRRLQQLLMRQGQFRIPPKELEQIHPKQLLMLLTAGEAIADAGGLAADQSHPDTGIIIAAGTDLTTTQYSLRWLLPPWLCQCLGYGADAPLPEKWQQWLIAMQDRLSPALNATRTIGGLGNIVASRIAREFRIAGPSFSICQGTAGGLTAVHMACDLLQDSPWRRMVVGAVDFPQDFREQPTSGWRYRNQLQGFAPWQNSSEHALPLDAAGAVVLKPLEQARADGDTIYALVEDSLCGQGTATGVYPQAAGKAVAHRLAPKLTPEVDAVVPQACGDPQWDKAEQQTLAAITQQGPFYAQLPGNGLGSAGSAQGLLQLLQASFSLYYKRLLPQPQTETATASHLPGWLRLHGPAPWLHNRRQGQRKALIISAAIQGAYSSVLVRQGPASPQIAPPLLSPPAPSARYLAFSADSAKQLLQQLTACSDSLPATSGLVTAGSCAAGTYRLAVVASTQKQWQQLCRQAQEHLQHNPQQPLPPQGFHPQQQLYYQPDSAPGSFQETAFVYPGSGNHFSDMGRATGLWFPGIWPQQEQANERLKDQYLPHRLWTLPERYLDLDQNSLIMSHVALCTALTDSLQQLGVTPGAAIGYSLGEPAAMFSLGVWQDRDTMLARLENSPLFQQQLAGAYTAARHVWQLAADEAVPWTCGLVRGDITRVDDYCQQHPRVYRLIRNSAGEAIIGGHKAAVEQLLHTTQVAFWPLSGISTVHCPLLEPAAAAYRQLHLFPVTDPGKIRFYSSAWATSYEPTAETIADAILAQARQAVDFDQVIRQAYADGLRVFIEAGPGRSLCRIISEVLGPDADYVCLPTCDPQQETSSTWARLAAALFVRQGQCLQLPQPQTTTSPATSAYLSVPLPADQWHPLPLPEKQPAAPDQHNPEPSQAKTPAAASQRATGLPRLMAGMAATQQAHSAFLQWSQSLQQALHHNLAFQQQLRHCLGGAAVEAEAPSDAPAVAASRSKKLFLDRQGCLEFARGRISRALGSAWAAVDTYPTRVRLPDEPLMLVDRVPHIEGTPRQPGPGRIVTEHDLHYQRWYLDNQRIPAALAIESGQADLLLSAYLGIDFYTQGLALYRLLDATVTFHRSLPEPEAVLSYDIRIERFFRQGQTHLFRFNFEASCDGSPLLSMHNGCAGFFSHEELEDGRGLVRPLDGPLPDMAPPAAPLAPMPMQPLSSNQIQCLRQGELSALGPGFEALELPNPLTLPQDKLALLADLPRLDLKGGHYGYGFAEGRMEIAPDAWHLQCHFCDDPVMPGTLMYEACLHTLRLFMLRFGWVGSKDQCHFDVIPQQPIQLRCRGQVTARTPQVHYQIHVRQLGYRPEPYAMADAVIYTGDKAIVEVRNLGLRLTGTDAASLEQLWRPFAPAEKELTADHDHILAFAEGDPVAGLGRQYAPWQDGQRFLARLPSRPFNLLHGITAGHYHPGKLNRGSWLTGNHRFDHSHSQLGIALQRPVPASAVLEAGLQACGWLAAAMGSARYSQEDLYFRNLHGQGQFHSPLPQAPITLTSRVSLDHWQQQDNSLLQSYAFSLESEHSTLFTATTSSGFFPGSQLTGSPEASASAPLKAWPEAAHSAAQNTGTAQEPTPLQSLYLWHPQGGRAGMGYVAAGTPLSHFNQLFAAHFPGDPILPGTIALDGCLRTANLLLSYRFGQPDLPGWGEPVAGAPFHWQLLQQVRPGSGDLCYHVEVWEMQPQKQRLTCGAWVTLGAQGPVVVRFTSLHLQWHCEQ